MAASSNDRPFAVTDRSRSPPRLGERRCVPHHIRNCKPGD